MNLQTNEATAYLTGDVEIIANSGSLPIIIFLHGAVVNRKMWSLHMNLLSHDYNILAPDLPGHGSLSNQPFTLSRSVEHIVGLLNELNDWPVILVGDSLGGYVAMATASKYPEKLSALIVSGCTKNYMGFWGSLLKANAQIGQRIIKLIGEDKLINITKKKLRKKIDSKLMDEIFNECVRISSRMEALIELTNRNFSSPLASFGKPVLFINGEKDRINRWAENQFVNAIKNAKLITIAKADHFVALTQPQKYVEAITAFLEEENITV